MGPSGAPSPPGKRVGSAAVGVGVMEVEPDEVNVRSCHQAIGALTIAWGLLAPARAITGEAPGSLPPLPIPALSRREPPVETQPAPQEGRLQLTLDDVISRGLRQNLAAIVAREDLRAAKGGRLVAWSGLLPSLTAQLAAAREKISLAQYGFPVAPGQSPLLGPFNVVLAEITLSQKLFDVRAAGAAGAGSARLAAARFSLQDTRDGVVALCAGLYLQAVAAESRVEAAEAQLTTAETLATRAHDMHAAGTVPGIEALRADVQLAAQRQRVIQARNDRDRQRLALAHAIGLPLEQAFDLVDRVPYATISAVAPDEALRQALSARADLKGATARLRAAEAEQAAALGETLPSLSASASLTEVCPSAGDMQRTYAFMIALGIPLFEGGRAQGHIAESRAAVERQRARVNDLKAGIDLEVRTALLDLGAAAQQVEVARDARGLAEQQLTQAKDRFEAGVASNIEVVEAQQALAEASETYITSLLAHNLAKLALARAMGTAESQAARLLGGRE